jgi:hypothetical protein
VKPRATVGVAALLTSPLALLSGLIWLDILVNPLESAFVDSARLQNKTSRVIRVTPLGRVGNEPRVLPQSYWARPPVPVLFPSRHRAMPGEQLTVVYDGDDIQMSELVIETANSPARVLSDHPSSEKSSLYVLEDLSALPLAPPSTLGAVGSGPDLLAWGGLLGFLVPLLLGAAWHARRDRRPKSSDVRRTAPSGTRRTAPAG